MRLHTMSKLTTTGVTLRRLVYLLQSSISRSLLPCLQQGLSSLDIRLS